MLKRPTRVVDHCRRRSFGTAAISFQPQRHNLPSLRPFAELLLASVMMLSFLSILQIAMLAATFSTSAFTPTPFTRKLTVRPNYRGSGQVTDWTYRNNNNRIHQSTILSNLRRNALAISRTSEESIVAPLNDTLLSPDTPSTITSANRTFNASDCNSLDYEGDANTNNANEWSSRMNDAMIDELYSSLLFKVASYNPAIISLSLTTAENTPNANYSSNTTSEPLISILRHAYRYARSALEGKRKKSGEAYIAHSLGVAHIIADMKLDLPSLLTALLHGTVEGTNLSLDDISNTFGEKIARLVDGVATVGKRMPSTRSHEERQSENYRKFILSTSRDIRVLLVALADRAHVVRTLRRASPEERRRIAKETMEIHVPLAHRLGMYRLKTELEDECFRLLSPEICERLEESVRGSEAERKRHEENVVDSLVEKMRDAGVGQGKNDTLVVTGRTKGLYSIHTKMRRNRIKFDDIHDIVAFRIIVDDAASCYQALGVVHSHFKPVPGRIKDYIALPKPNGYRSLHTTVIGPKGKVEVQIRTNDMHLESESGIASHWIYKQGGEKGRNPKKTAERFAWLRELVQDVRRQPDPKEFGQSVNKDLMLTNEVFVFTPKGDLYALARGSSALDFAFKVHSQIGSHCVGAKVNGKQVTLRHLIKDGDTVEVLTSNRQTPKREWLTYVQTSKAKNRIQSWLKRTERDESISVGKKMVKQGLKAYSPRGEDAGNKEYQRKLTHLLTTFKLKDENNLLMALGYDQITLESVMIEVFGVAAVKTRGKRNKREKDDQYILSAKRSTYPDVSHQSPSSLNKNGIIVGQERNILLKFCKNCNPLMGEKIRGVVSHGKGVSVHRLECKYLLEADDERIVDVQWDEDRANIRRRPVELQVLCEDTPGVLADMSRTISSLGINIGNVNLRRLSNGRGLARLQVMLGRLEELEKVMTHLRKEEGILSVARK